MRRAVDDGSAEGSDAFVLAGFAVGGTWTPSARQRGSLLPATMVTVSDCLIDLVEPARAAYAVPWFGREGQAFAAAHGSGQVDRVRVIAIHLPVADRNAFVSLIDAWTSQAIRANVSSTTHPIGEPRGFEVVGFEAGRFHSWHCYGLHERAIAVGHDLQLTELGLLTSLDQARAVAGMANADRDTPNGAPLDVTWFPVLLGECRPWPYGDHNEPTRTTRGRSGCSPAGVDQSSA